MTPEEFNKFREEHPEISDPTKSKSAYGIMGEYIDKLEKHMIPGTFKTKQP